MVLIMGIRGVRSSVRLDSTSVSIGERNRRITLHLANVGGIIALQRGGVTTRYQVLDSDQVPVIGWNAQQRGSVVKPSRSQMQEVLPDELAALVAKRTGKPVERRTVSSRTSAPMSRNRRPAQQQAADARAGVSAAPLPAAEQGGAGEEER